VHFLATSRPEQAIHLTRLNYTCFDMEAGAISLDTQRYIEEEIRNDWKLSKVLHKDSDLIGQIVANADGMFRLVAFCLEQLRACQTPYQVQQELKDLPRDLDAMYKHMILKICDADCPHVLVILQWLAFSTRTLELAELAEVVAVDFVGRDKPYFDVQHRFYESQEVIGVCGGLVTASNDEVKLSHLTVKEYLCSDRHAQDFSVFFLSASLAHAVITQTCLAYLLQFTTANPVDRITIQSQFPLSDYAAS